MFEKEKRPRIFLKSLMLILTMIIHCSIFTTATYAQKPKLGLVLSGGGAKGMAHVGVLKAMEQAGLRPDYITGTSMGSIIGGLYALGYSADQIESILREIRWDEILSNNIPMNYISYEEKEYYNRFLIELPLIEGKLSLPTGVIEGQMLSEALNHYTWPSVKYSSFDDMPIPFRCVATDVSTGEPIIFKEGSLAEALRASMAIPTAFSAANLDSTLAVDGGIVNNFPADVLKKMGADIIIGVNVARGFVEASEVGSLAGILMQMAMLSSNQRLPENIALCDVYLQPNLDDYNTASFSKYDEIIKIGDEIGQNFLPKFDSIAKLTGRNEKPSGINEVSAPLVISKIDLDGNELFNDDVVKGKLGINVGDTVSTSEVEEGVRTVYGINGFYKVEYRLNQLDSSKMSLKINMHEKPPITARASFHYDNLFSAGIVVNLQFRDLLFKSSRTILAGDASVNPRFRFDYYKYIGRNKKTALNLRYDYFNEQIPTYDKGRKDDLEASFENSFKVNLLTTQSLKNSYLIGFDHENTRFRSVFNDIFASGLEYGQFTFSSLKFAFTRNTLNNQNYPTRGAERLIVTQAYLDNQYRFAFSEGLDSINFGSGLQEVYISTDKANQVLEELEPSYYGSFYFRSLDYTYVNDYFQVIPYFAGALTLAQDTTAKIYNPFPVGGHQQVKITDTKFFGLNYNELGLENFAIGGLMMQNVYKNFYLQYGTNVLFYHNYVPVDRPSEVDFQNVLENQTIIGYGGELTYKSFIGPITFGMSSNSTDGYVRYYFALGYSFNYSD